MLLRKDSGLSLGEKLLFQLLCLPNAKDKRGKIIKRENAKVKPVNKKITVHPPRRLRYKLKLCLRDT